MEALTNALAQLVALEARVQDLVDPALSIGEALKAVVKEGAIVIEAIHARVEELEAATPGTASPALTELVAKVDGLVSRLGSIESNVSGLSSSVSSLSSSVSNLSSRVGPLETMASTAASNIAALFASVEAISHAPAIESDVTTQATTAAAPATTSEPAAGAPAAEGSGT